MERWKDISGYEGLYQISDCGKVKSLYKNRLLNPTKTSTGYWKVELFKNKSKKSYKIHRLVAKAFIPEIKGKDVVNHINGNPLDNYYKNLEWCTQKENVNHALRTGLIKVKTYSKEELENFINRYTSHPREVSRILHISYERFKKMCAEYGIKIYKRNKYHIEKAELIKCFDSGLCTSEISKKFNCPSNYIARRRYQHKKGDF